MTEILGVSGVLGDQKAAVPISTAPTLPPITRYTGTLAELTSLTYRILTPFLLRAPAV